MKAISLHQPWASLLVTRQPCISPSGRHSACTLHPMVKRIETRSWPCPPNLIGQPLIFHATKRRPPSFWMHERDDVCHAVNKHGRTVDPVVPLDQIDHFYDATESSEADGWFLYRWAGGPLGAVVGSGVVEACLPIVAEDDLDDDDSRQGVVRIYDEGACMPSPGGVRSISDQLPYGDFTPGRWAWLITDAAPTTELCPWCLGDGCDSPCLGAHPDDGRPHNPCPVCGRIGNCDPIPARGHQRIWNWQP